MFLENIKKRGCVEVICGSMFSGKTEELIRRVKRASFAKQKIEIFKPVLDNRYSELDVVSHDRHTIPCKLISKAEEILQQVDDDVQVVGIDEAQFLGTALLEIVQKLANSGKRVIIAGLDMDYMGNPFEPIPSLVAIAEYVQKVHAICVKCGNLASYSHRLSQNKDLVVIGEKDIYEPLCRECFNAALAKDKKD